MDDVENTVADVEAHGESLVKTAKENDPAAKVKNENPETENASNEALKDDSITHSSTENIKDVETDKNTIRTTPEMSVNEQTDKVKVNDEDKEKETEENYNTVENSDKNNNIVENVTKKVVATDDNVDGETLSFDQRETTNNTSSLVTNVESANTIEHERKSSIDNSATGAISDNSDNKASYPENLHKTEIIIDQKLEENDAKIDESNDKINEEKSKIDYNEKSNDNSSNKISDNELQADLLSFTAGLKSNKKDSVTSLLNDDPTLLDDVIHHNNDVNITEVDVSAQRKSDVNIEAMKYESEFLTRRIKENKEDGEYMKSKLEEKDVKLAQAEKTVKDLKLRLIRFAKDDEAKDRHVATLEQEVKEMNERIEEMMNEQSSKTKNNDTTVQQPTAATQKQSKTCILL